MACIVFEKMVVLMGSCPSVWALGSDNFVDDMVLMNNDVAAWYLFDCALMFDLDTVEGSYFVAMLKELDNFEDVSACLLHSSLL